MSKDANNISSYERAFNYYYDALNRDTAAIYNERPTAATTAFTVTHGWDENRITYDQNGNLLTLFRMDATQGAGNHVPIDNLTYTYDTTNPNQLLKVADGTGGSYNTAGFMVYPTGNASGSYGYDPNGNLVSDPYKNLSFDPYNFLNKASKITLSTGNYTDYTYDAAGNLVRKRQYSSGTLTTTTDYIDGFVYINTTLSYFPMPEGRVVNNSGTLVQEFVITDQQGNARVSFWNNGANNVIIRQENSYYAFGLIMPGSTVSTPNIANKQLYNGGSEWQNDFGNLPDYYQTFNRNYDAALGRFVGVDPIAESAESMTSYQYAGNDPIMFNDPTGDVTDYNGYTNEQIGLLGLPGLGGVPHRGGHYEPTDIFQGVDIEAHGGDDDDTESPGFTASGFLNAFSELWNSTYGGTATPNGFELYQNGAEELTSGFLQMSQLGLVGSPDLPGSAGSWAEAVFRYDNDPQRKGGILNVGNSNAYPSYNGYSYYNSYRDADGNFTTIGGVSAISELSEIFINGNKQDEGGDPIADQVDLLDKGLTVASSPGLFNDAYKLATESSMAMKYIGKFTGLYSIVTNATKGIHEIKKGNYLMGAWHATETIGQTVLILGGGEDLELGWNVGTFLIDGAIDIFKKK